jgi:tetratricopeptide (TPR) repeat protein
LASSYFAAAESYRRQGRHAEAEPLYQLSLAIDEGRLGSDDPLVIDTVIRLAHVYREQGKFPPAESLYDRAVRSLEGRSGSEGLLAEGLEGYAFLLRATDREVRADSLEDRARSLRAGLASEG